jgi:hypothetical protein
MGKERKGIRTPTEGRRKTKMNESIISTLVFINSL